MGFLDYLFGGYDKQQNNNTFLSENKTKKADNSVSNPFLSNDKEYENLNPADSLFQYNTNPETNFGIEHTYQANEKKQQEILQKLQARISKIEENTTQAEKNSSVVGKAWSWMKNNIPLLDKITDSSNEVRTQGINEQKILEAVNKGEKTIEQAFTEITGVEFTEENINKFLDENNDEIKTKSEQALKAYEEGQNDSADFVSDMLSGVVSMGIYSAGIAVATTIGAPFALAAGIAVGGAAALGAGIKVGIKALDSVGGDKEYKVTAKDLIFGGLNGALAPLTAGLGGKLGASVVGSKLFGGVAVKEGTEIVTSNAAEKGIKAFVKEALMNPMGNIYKGSFGARAAGYVTELGVDGGLGGAIDAGGRTAYDGGSAGDIAMSALGGGVMGSLAGIGLGGFFKWFGNRSHQAGTELGNRVNAGKPADEIGSNSHNNAPSSQQSTIRGEEADAPQLSLTRGEGANTPVETQTKKQYQKPETKQRSLVGEDDLMADTSKPAKIKSTEERLNLVPSKPVATIKQVKEMLLDLGFPKEEVENFKYTENALKNITYIHLLIKDDMVPEHKGTNWASAEAKKARDEIFGYLNDKPQAGIEFITKENLNELKKYINLENADDIGKILNCFESDFFKEHFDELMRIIPIITKNGKAKMSPKGVGQLRTLNNSAFPYITRERAKFVEKINSKVPERYQLDFYDFEYLGDIETLTEELAQAYVNEVNRFIKHKLQNNTSLYTDGLKNNIAQMRKISDFLDKYPLELRVYQDGLMCTHDIISIMDRPDIKKIQKLLHEMTPEAKEAILVDRLPKPDSDIPFDKWRDFFNFLGKGNFGREFRDYERYKFVDFVNNHNIKDLDGFMDYMEVLRDTYPYRHTYGLTEYFCVANGDYRGAAAYLKEIKSFCDKISPECYDNQFVTYSLKYIIAKKDINFSEVIKRFQYLKSKNVELNEDRTNLYIISVSKHPETAEITEILAKTGFEINSNVNDYIFKRPEMTAEKVRGMVDNFLNELKKQSGLDDTYSDDMIKLVALNKDASSTFCGIFYSGKVCPNEAINSVKNILRKDNKPFFDKFWNNPDYSYTKEALFKFAEFVNSKNIDLAIKLCSDKELAKDSDFIIKILNYSNQNSHKAMMADVLLFDKQLNFPRDLIPGVVSSIDEYNFKFAEKLCTDKTLNFPKNKIGTIVSSTRFYNLDFAEKLCYDKDFPKDLISDILSKTKNDTMNFADWICFDKELNFPKKHIAELLGATKSQNIDLVKRLLTDKELNFPQNEIAKFVKNINQNNETLIKILLEDKTFPKKHLTVFAIFSSKKANLDTVEEFLSSPELKNWMIKNLDEGQSLSALVGLARTQKRLFKDRKNGVNRTNRVNNGDQVQTGVKVDTTSMSIVEQQALSKITSFGIDEKLAKGFLKKVQTNGKVDNLKLETLEKLFSVCKDKKEMAGLIKDFDYIFDCAIGSELSAKNSQFRVELIDDIIKLRKCGFGFKLATNLSSIKNMDYPEMKVRIKEDKRKETVNKVVSILNSENGSRLRANLEKEGFDIDEILSTAKSEPKTKGKTLKGAEEGTTVKLRKIDELHGAERILANKYKDKLPAETWANPEKFRAWAKEQFENLCDWDKNPQFHAKGQFENYNKARQEGIEAWKKYLTEESNYTDDPFVHFLVMSEVTKSMKPDNAHTPKNVNAEIFNQTYNALLDADGTSFNFDKVYTRTAKQKAIDNYVTDIVEKDGVEQGRWVRVPTSKKGDKDYDLHVSMIQGLAEGSSWCLRHDNAHGYHQQGDIWFYVDSNGNSQTAITVSPEKEILHIEKRYDENGTAPIPYIDEIIAWRDKYKFTGKENVIQTAKNAKPDFDSRKAKLTGLIEEADRLAKEQGGIPNYEAVFKEMGITVTKAEDGTLILSKYSPFVTKLFTLFDLGINENKLLRYVSEINSDINFNGSAASELPFLRKIKGSLQFGDSKINDLSGLTEINGHKVVWIK